MLQEMPWNICWNVHGLTWRVTSSYIQYTVLVHMHSAPEIISRADRERCKGFRIPVKNSYLLNSLSKIIENNKPQPVPLFRFLGNILYTRICLIFFFKSEPVWPFFVVWGLMWPWRHRTLELLNKTLRPWSGGGGWCVGWWVVVKAKYIYVNFSMDLVPRMSIDRLIG